MKASLRHQHARLLRALGLVIGGFFIAACSPPHQKLNLAGNNWLGYQPFFVAQERLTGSDEFSELSIHPLPATSNVIRLMEEGQLDGGFLTVGEALTYQQGAVNPLCVAMVVDVSMGGDALVMKHAWRESTKPLTIAHEASAVGGYLLQRAKQQGVFSGYDVSYVTATLNRHLTLFESDGVDGVVTFHPVLSQLKKRNAEVVFDSADIAGEIVDVLVVKRSVWQQHQPHIERKLVSLWKRAVTHFQPLSEEVADIVSANTGLSTAEIEDALTGIKLVGATNEFEFNLQQPVEKIGQYLQDVGRIQQKQSLGYCSSGEAVQ